jgi:hypothetical protein
MKQSTIKVLLFSTIISFLLYSCGGGETEIIEDDTTTDEITDETDLMENNTTYILPSPLQVAELFKSAGLTYVGDLTNPKENVDKYATKYDQKLNFGVYSADMAYCIMNNQSQESIDYLNALREISEKLWMTDVFNTLGLRDRLEANVGNEDSLTYIMADLQIQLDDYLDENGMGYTGSVIFAGAWLETMYLGTQVNKLEKNEKLISRLSEQSVILGDLIKSIQQADEDNEYTELIADLGGIDKHFDILRGEETEEDVILNDEQVDALSKDIIALRNKVIGE